MQRRYRTLNRVPEKAIPAKTVERHQWKSVWASRRETDYSLEHRISTPLEFVDDLASRTVIMPDLSRLIEAAPRLSHSVAAHWISNSVVSGKAFLPTGIAEKKLRFLVGAGVYSPRGLE